jgi:hypothetical protein
MIEKSGEASVVFSTAHGGLPGEALKPATFIALDISKSLESYGHKS